MSKEDLKIPDTLGACADLLFDIREERYRLQKLVTAQEEKETLLKEHILRTMDADTSVVGGLRYKAERVRKSKPVVRDWEALWKYVYRNKASEFLQRRIADGAIQERWDAGKKIPGVEPFQYVTLSLTKV